MMVLALCWHPGRTNIQTAGGFKRFYEVLKRAPCPVTVLDKYPSIYSQIKNPRVTVIEYGRNKKTSWVTDRFISAYYLLINSFSLKTRPEIIYVPFSELPHLSFVAVILKLAFHCRLVFCNLNINRIYTDRLANAVFHRFANEIITLSKPLQNDLAKTGIFASGLNGVGFTRPRFSFHGERKIYDAVFIGRHTPEKGFYDLIGIWKQLHLKATRNYKLVTIGDLPDIYKARIAAKIAQSNLQNAIFMKGNVTEREKYQLLSQSKICVFPSYHEGWGIVPQEALSSGLPTLAYDLPVYKDSLPTTPMFRTVRIGDRRQFLRQMKFLLSRYKSLTKTSSKWRPSLTWDTVAKREWNLICRP